MRPLFKNLRYSLAIFLISILTPILMFSETSIKSIIQSWFETCSVVIHKNNFHVEEDTKTKSMDVSLYLTGDVPDKFDLVFYTKPEMYVLDYVSLSGGNTVRHPQQDLKCGSEAITTAKNKGLCSDSINLTTPANEQYYKAIAINVLNIGPRYNYKYKIDVYDEKGIFRKENLIVSVDFGNSPAGDSKRNFCRAEEADIFNVMAWGSPLLKTSLLALLLISCIFITTTLKQWINNP